MLPLYLLLAFVCLLVCAFTSFDVKHLSRVEKDEDVLVSIGQRKFIKKMSNLEIIGIVIFSLEIVNTLSLLLGSAMIAVSINELYSENKIMWLIIYEVIYGVILVIFSYYLPRAIARRGEAPTKVVANTLVVGMFYPLHLLNNKFKKLFTKKSQEEEKIDEDVLNEMVDSFEEEGVIEEDEADMVRGAIDLHNIEADQIMTPRVDVYAIEVGEDIDEMIKSGEIYTHSRIPVYEDTIDHIVGILPSNALNKATLRGEKDINIKSLCYQPLFIASNYPVIDLLRDFRKTKVHIAVVLDEFGGTKGIVTMEDVLEEIVGNIYDETDEVEEEVKDKGHGVYIVDGSMNIDDFFFEIGYEDEYEGDFVTVSGFCQELLNRFPEKGDVIHFHNYVFKVLSLDGYVIDKLEVKTLNEE